ncbi:hypothetical protein ABT282_08765 [Streptomyces sp. NPDC000927]|uniref:hypothetical protein n=1 Tax=Streptomyces sp. NPDC000927 TaxID=3154371 RepID=UPI00331AB14F
MDKERLPDFFRDQLPDAIKRIVDHPDHDPLGEWVDDYTYMTQYTHPIIARSGEESETTLATIMSVSSEIAPTVGQEVCLYGVWVTIVSVLRDIEADEDDGRTITFYTATVKASK